MSLIEKLAAERRGRLAAERLLELKQAELYAANRKLGLHARALSEKIVETRAVVASVQDENRRVKSDLTVAHKKVEIAERRLWQSLETIRDGFAFFDEDDQMIAANDSYMVVFEGIEEVRPGIPYARLLQLLTEEGIVDPGDMSRPEWRSEMLRRRQAAEPEPVTIRLWNDQYIKMVDQRGASGDLISLGLNITSTVRYERELKDARIKAEAAARAKSAFLANMSHEIRTPMNGVVGMADLLGDSTLDEDQSVYVQTIKNSGEALLVIINDILDYSKMDAQKMVLHTGPFDLEKSIHEVLMLLQPAAREKNLALLLDYDLFLPQTFIGDAGRIRQILTNLIGNAVKFTMEGHVLVRVTGAPTADGQSTTLHIAIEDTGIGIPEDQISHIFGEFTQVEEERNRQFEGTGLGLAISRKLVELMTGEIWATSEVGVGSCFGFKIPLLKSDEDPVLPPVLPENLRSALIVDDNATNVEILRKQLEMMHVATDGYVSAKDALATLEDGYDLIIVDQVMPEMNGVEFVLEVRNQGYETPIVMMTSNPDLQQTAPIEDELSALLARPLSRERLFKTLTDLGAKIDAPSSEGPTEDLPEKDTAFPVFRSRARLEAIESDPVHPVEAVVEEPSFDVAVDEPKAAPLAQTDIENSPEGVLDDIAPSTDQPADPIDDAPDISIEHTEQIAPVLRRLRILAAEDNKTNQLVFRKMIKSLGVELQFANNGFEAVEAYKSFDPDIIFMDISMPGMDGKEATGAIRQLEENGSGHVPIVALTAHAMEGDDHGILAAGLDFYLTKPLRKNVIYDKIRQQVTDEMEDPFANLPD